MTSVEQRVLSEGDPPSFFLLLTSSFCFSRRPPIPFFFRRDQLQKNNRVFAVLRFDHKDRKAHRFVATCGPFCFLLSRPSKGTKIKPIKSHGPLFYSLDFPQRHGAPRSYFAFSPSLILYPVLFSADPVVMVMPDRHAYSNWIFNISNLRVSSIMTAENDA